MSRFRDEIGEQPLLAKRMLADSRTAIASIASRLNASRPRGFVIVARGSSDHRALYPKYLLGVRNHVMVTLPAPSLFTSYGSPPSLDGECVIGISQSGESPDVIAVINEAARQGAVTLAITNDPSSPLAQAAELVLPLGAGPEQSVPASKTYIASLLALALISQALDPDASFEAALGQVPPALAAAPDGQTTTTVSLDSGLPEELTPLTLAVLGQLLAHRVALARGIDPDRPRALNKVTRTW